MTFWDYAAISIALAMVRNGLFGGRGLNPTEIARMAAEVADRLEEERIRRAPGSKPS